MASKPLSNDAGLMSMKEAAAYFGKTERAFRKIYARWNLPHIKLGGQIKFTKELLDEYIKKQTVNA